MRPSAHRAWVSPGMSSNQSEVNSRFLGPAEQSRKLPATSSNWQMESAIGSAQRTRPRRLRAVDFAISVVVPAFARIPEKRDGKGKRTVVAALLTANIWKTFANGEGT